MTFHCSDVNGGSTDDVGIIVVLMGAGKADTVHFFFVGLVCGDDTNVAGCAVCGLFVTVDRHHSRCAVGTEAAVFFAETAEPFVAIWQFEELSIFVGLSDGGI